MLVGNGLGVALYKFDDPAQILGVGDRWILQSEDPWEVTGYVHNVVFTCGSIHARGQLQHDIGGAGRVFIGAIGWKIPLFLRYHLQMTAEYDIMPN